MKEEKDKIFVLRHFTIGNATVVISFVNGDMVIGMDAPDEEKKLTIPREELKTLV